jgi:hypothetical protein
MIIFPFVVVHQFAFHLIGTDSFSCFKGSLLILLFIQWLSAILVIFFVVHGVLHAVTGHGGREGWGEHGVRLTNNLTNY